MATATFKIWRGDANGGGFKEYKAEISEGMVVLDAVHEIQVPRRLIWPADGIVRRGNAAPVRRK